MNPLAVLLILISTFFHAGWNLLTRSQRAEHAFLLRTLWLSAGIALVPAILGLALAEPFPVRVWWCVLGSGTCIGVYFFSLARAYGTGEFTVVYPIARALPVVLVAFGDLVRGRLPTSWGWTGMLLVVLACVLLPTHSLRTFSRRTYLNRSFLWIVLTALGTVGYTLIDKLAAEAVKAGPVSAITYGAILYILGAVVYSLCVWVLGRPEEDAQSVGWKRPLLAAVLTFGSYGLVLWAYQLVRHAGYVVAFRQFSIVLGVAVALIWFKEKGAAIRLSATCVMVAGLVLIALLG